MAFCPKCGTEVPQGSAFCPACGVPQPSVTQTPPPPPGRIASGSPLFSENVAGALCYLLGWLTGLIFYLIDKRPYVRFHAAQSMVVFGGLHILIFALDALFGAALPMVIFRLVHLFIFVLWVVLIIKAYQGQRFRVPLAAEIAENLFNKRNPSTT